MCINTDYLLRFIKFLKWTSPHIWRILWKKKHDSFDEMTKSEKYSNWKKRGGEGGGKILNSGEEEAKILIIFISKLIYKEKVPCTVILTLNPPPPPWFLVAELGGGRVGHLQAIENLRIVKSGHIWNFCSSLEWFEVKYQKSQLNHAEEDLKNWKIKRRKCLVFLDYFYFRICARGGESQRRN